MKERMIVRLGLTALVCYFASIGRGTDILLEAEDFDIRSGWRVVRGYEGITPGQPNQWSGNRLMADAEMAGRPAVARKRIEIPASGVYNLWVRYESGYGFHSRFGIEVTQGRDMKLDAEFGGRDDVKYFGRGWLVQGPWHHHNADYVYQKAEVHLEEGRADISLIAGENGHPAAVRVLDLLYLTRDLDLEPGNDWAWRAEGILPRFRKPAWFKIRVPADAEGPALVRFHTRVWLVGYYKGPRLDYFFTPTELVSDEPSEELRLAPGSETPWLRADFPSAYPALIFPESDREVELLITRDPSSRERPESFQLEIAGERVRGGRWMYATPGIRPIIVCTGHDTYGAPILQGRPAVALDEYLARMTGELENMTVEPGRRPRRLELRHLNVNLAGFDMRPMAKALGLTVLRASADRAEDPVYGPEGEEFGFIQDVIHTAAARNVQMRVPFLEGDRDGYRKALERQRDELTEQGYGDILHVRSLIEEGSAPRLSQEWSDIMQEQFRDYLKERGVRPETVIPRETLLEILAGKSLPKEKELWEHVRIGTGSPEEAVACPALFYHSQYFRNIMFYQGNKAATLMAEEIFPKGTVTHSGTIMPSIGSRPPWRVGVDLFHSYRNRAFTAYSTEFSWCLNTPDYTGVQMQSYEGALGRGLGRYHDIPLYTLFLSDGQRGYRPDFIELGAYALAANGFRGWLYYNIFYPCGCSNLGVPDTLRAVRRANYTLGVVEDQLLDSSVLPGRVALAWLATTDIWDMREPLINWLEDFGNIIYSSERVYLYLLLRHLQAPVELIGEDDIVAGDLKDYDMFVLVGDHLLDSAAEAVKEWVAGGGYLFSVAGGGLRDQYNRPNEMLYEVFGIEDANLEKKTTALRPKLELMHALPLDEIKLEGGEVMPLYGYKQDFTVAGGDVSGRFRNGAAAAVANVYGDGRALIVGGLPGHSYLAGAYPMLPFGRAGDDDLSTHYFPDYNLGVREAITSLLEDAPMTGPVVSGHPLVEVLVLRGREDGAHHLALVNYSGTKLDEVVVSIDTGVLPGLEDGDSPFGDVRAERRGRFLDLRMPIDKFNFVTLK